MSLWQLTKSILFFLLICLMALTFSVALLIGMAQGDGVAWAAFVGLSIT